MVAQVLFHLFRIKTAQSTTAITLIMIRYCESKSKKVVIAKAFVKSPKQSKSRESKRK